MKSPIDLLADLVGVDFTRFDSDVKGLQRDIRTLEYRYENEGYGFLTVALPRLGEAIERGLADGVFCCPLGFKKLRGSSLPRLFSGLMSEVFDVKTGLVRVDYSQSALKSLIEVTYMCKKILLSEERSDKLHSEAVESFFQNDDLIGVHELDSRQSHHFGLVCQYVLNDLQNYDDNPVTYSDDELHELTVPLDFRKNLRVDRYTGKHGPGAVSERLSSNRKWIRTYHGILTDAFGGTLPSYDLFGCLDHLDLSSDDLRIEDMRKFLKIPPESAASRSTARLISVPKNSTSRRTITVEPTLNQFVQQALNTELRDSISKCSILRNCLALTDQSENQKLAMEGSIHANWATLDLKSASDLLSEKIVRQTFSHLPEFLGRMLDCRSSYVECDNVTRNVRKYAGMGNATTFPVQSVVFALLAIAAILDQDGKYPSYRRVRRASRCIRVFGDDIIVDNRYTTSVVSWLECAGLKINTSKSFFGGYFKESCGVRCYKGVDYTPIYLKHRPDDSSTESRAIEGLISFSNNAWMRGLYKVSNRIAGEVEDRLKINLPLVPSYSAALGWHCRRETCDFHSWNHKLHRPETASVVYLPVKRQDPLDGYPALLKFFHVPLLGRPRDHLKRSSVRFKLRLAKRRVPAYAGLSHLQ